MPPMRTFTSSSAPTSAMRRRSMLSATARRTCAFTLTRKRCRLGRLLPCGLGRRSTIIMATSASLAAGRGGCPPRILHPPEPLHGTAPLALGIAALLHAGDEVAVLALGVDVLLGAEGND